MKLHSLMASVQYLLIASFTVQAKYVSVKSLIQAHLRFSSNTSENWTSHLKSLPEEINCFVLIGTCAVNHYQIVCAAAHVFWLASVLPLVKFHY